MYIYIYICIYIYMCVCACACVYSVQSLGCLYIHAGDQRLRLEVSEAPDVSDFPSTLLNFGGTLCPELTVPEKLARKGLGFRVHDLGPRIQPQAQIPRIPPRSNSYTLNFQNEIPHSKPYTRNPKLPNYNYTFPDPRKDLKCRSPPKFGYFLDPPGGLGPRSSGPGLKPFGCS